MTPMMTVLVAPFSVAVIFGLKPIPAALAVTLKVAVCAPEATVTDAGMVRVPARSTAKATLVGAGAALEMVTLNASVNAAWHTSMEVGVRVEAENPRTAAVRHTNTAYLTLVAVDDEGNPVAVPPRRTATADERRREAEAQLRRENRLAEREQIRERRKAEG